MKLKANDLILVRHEEPDPAVALILDDPEILETLSEARSYPAPMPASICFRIEKEGEVIGQVCLKRIRWINHKAEISLFISRSMQGRGYGRQAIESIIEFGFKRLNLYRLEAEVIDGNKASLKLLKRSGFIEEGRLRKAKFVKGEYKDLLRFGLLKDEYTE
ncbi:MAG: GNAT family protein [Bacteroidales bacterium]|nr:GNAT family protein [Bacteroidales bacterium]